LKEGSFKFWNSKSVLVAERNYIHDTLVGNNTSWFDNGQLKQIADYENDFTQIYDKNGNIINEGSFIKIASQWGSLSYQTNRSSLSIAPLEPNVNWRYKTGNEVFSSPSVSGGMVFVGSYDNYIYALDQYTGALKWRYKTGNVVSSSPSVSGGMVFVGSNDNHIYAMGD
jgi:outer membrane protein assembly factor BamB